MMAQIIKFVLGGKANPKETEPIAAQPLKFPGMAGLGSALIALAGVALGVAKLLGWVHPTDTQLMAVLGFVAVGTIGFAIASAGDAIARAYVSAWVVPSKKEGNDTVPAGWVMIEATKAVAAGKAVPAVNHGPEHEIHTADRVTIEYKGARYSALELAIAEDGTFRYLIQEPDGARRWVDQTEAQFKAIA